jgi:hypothetical protein
MNSAGPLRKIIAIGVAVLLAAGIAVAIAISSGATSGGTKTVVISGLSGSEKIPYLSDPRVVKRLHQLGMDLQVEPAGSREIATKLDLSHYDFAFPAGVPAAKAIRDRYKTTFPPYSVFYTPMAIATFKPNAEILVANGLAFRQAGTYYLDVSRYLDAVQHGVKWSQLKDAAAYPVDKSVVITSTDVRSSNSAAMYLSLASYVANGDNTVATAAQANTVQPLMTALFLKQGFVASTSELPFQDYLTIGAGKSPLVMIYESQFVGAAASPTGGIRPDMTLMYPSPTVLSQHTFVPLTANGDKLGKALTTDPQLQQLAVEYGFRTAQPGAFARFTAAHHIQVPDSILNTVDPPSFEILEHMIKNIEQAYQEQSAAFQSPAPASAPTNQAGVAGGIP